MASLRKIMLVLGEGKKVATLPTPSGNAPDIEPFGKHLPRLI